MPVRATHLGDHLMRTAKLLLQNRSRALTGQAGIEPATYSLLFHLAGGAKRVSALAECVHNDVSTVSRQVATLTAHGLAEKVADAADGRAQVVVLTDAGRQTLTDLRAARDAWLESMLHDWPEDDVRRFSTYLERFSTALEDDRSPMKDSL